jgi:hypothetical protein
MEEFSRYSGMYLAHLFMNPYSDSETRIMSDHKRFMAMVIQQSKADAAAGENYKAETFAEFVDRDLTLITGVLPDKWITPPQSN